MSKVPAVHENLWVQCDSNFHEYVPLTPGGDTTICKDCYSRECKDCHKIETEDIMCPCWSPVGNNLADLKALFAEIDLSVSPAPEIKD